jgi:hypothetical protein
MRKNAPPRFNTRVQLSLSEGREVYALALKENRSQSATVSLLLREALASRRQAAVENDELLRAGATARVQQIVEALLKPSAESAE